MSYTKYENFTNNPVKIKILNLVLYSTDNGGPYDKMKTHTSKYYSKFTNVTTVYYQFDPSITEQYVYKNDTLLIRGKESYIPGILDKTVLALKYFKHNLNEYDYVVRSNISTIIRFDLLSEELNKNPVDYGSGLCIEDNGIKFCSGTSIIMSRQTVKELLERTHLLDRTIDDVSIGVLIQTHLPHIIMQYVLPDGFVHVDIQDNILNWLNEHPNIVYYRNRTDDRNMDARRVEVITNYLSDRI